MKNKVAGVVLFAIAFMFFFNFAGSYLRSMTRSITVLTSNNDVSYEATPKYDRDPYEMIEEAIQNRDSQVRIKDASFDLYWADIGAMDYSCFWLKRFSYSHSHQDGHDYLYVYFTYYDLSDYEIKYMKQQIDEKVSYIVSCFPYDASDCEKARIAHDILISDITYDKTFNRDYNENAYGGLVCGHAICSGYAASYCYVLNKIGIPCQIVHTPDHAYNRVGSTYVDVCWDDWDRVDAYGNPVLSYYYFGMDYQTINSQPDHAIQYVSKNNVCDNYIIPYYYASEGYMLSQYDYNSAVWIIRDQYNKGVIVPTILFTDRAAYEAFTNYMDSNVWTLMADIGYTGDYCEQYQDDDNLTWSVGFNQSVELDQY